MPHSETEVIRRSVLKGSLGKSPAGTESGEVVAMRALSRNGSCGWSLWGRGVGGLVRFGGPLGFGPVRLN